MAILYKQTDDDNLVRLAQLDDTRAFDELVRRYQQHVYGLTYKILRHEQDASEALQDTFLSAFRAIKKFKSEAKFSTWLYRIAANSSLMKLRKRRANHVSLEQPNAWSDDDEPLELQDWSKQPLEELLDEETRVVMAEGVRRLPDDLRIIFTLRNLDELGNAEVAEITGLTIAAVKSRLHRARVFLRNWVTGHFEERQSRRDVMYA
jgi:RNA polymerase sigma-70 factor (ECF subfamily)